MSANGRLLQAAGVKGGNSAAAADLGAAAAERRTTNGQASASGWQAEPEAKPSLLAQFTDSLKSLALRGSVYASFFVAKQPKRIRQVWMGTCRAGICRTRVPSFTLHTPCRHFCRACQSLRASHGVHGGWLLLMACARVMHAAEA